MGGAVAIGYGLENPRRVTGAVLLGPGGLGDTVPNQFLSWLITRLPGALLALTWYYGRLSSARMRKTMASLLHEGEDSPDFEALVAVLSEEARRKWQYREKSLDDWQIGGLAPFRLKINFLPELGRLTCPTLWLRGEKDQLISQSNMEQAARLAPKGKLIVIKNAGHLLPLEQPDIVNKAVADFLISNRI
jgi:pimeloyl-ACP methyl ester carboxylesterase